MPLGDILPIQGLPGQPDTGAEKPSFLELLTLLGGAGLQFGGHPLGPVLYGLGSVYAGARENRQNLRDQQQLSQALTGLTGQMSPELQALAGIPGMKPDFILKASKASEEKKAREQYGQLVQKYPGLEPGQQKAMLGEMGQQAIGAGFGGPLTSQVGRGLFGTGATAATKPLTGMAANYLAELHAENPTAPLESLVSAANRLAEKQQAVLAGQRAQAVAEGGLPAFYKKQAATAASKEEAAAKAPPKLGQGVNEELAGWGANLFNLPEEQRAEAISQAQESVALKKSRMKVTAAERDMGSAIKEASKLIPRVELDLKALGPVDAETMAKQGALYTAMRQKGAVGAGLKLGMAFTGAKPDPPFLRLFTDMGILSTRLVKPYMAGMRGYQMLQDLQQHLASIGEPTDTALESYSRVKGLIHDLAIEYSPTNNRREAAIKALTDPKNGKVDDLTGRVMSPSRAAYFVDKAMGLAPEPEAGAPQ